MSVAELEKYLLSWLDSFNLSGQEGALVIEKSGKGLGPEIS